MPALGLSCNIASGRVTARGVVVEAGRAVEVFHHRAAAGDDTSLQLRSLADALATRLADLEVDAVVVRTPDHHRAARLTDAVSMRLRAEGVLLATARSRVSQVESLSGRGIAELLGESKEAVDHRARELLSPAATEATAAALAAERRLQGAG